MANIVAGKATVYPVKRNVTFEEHQRLRVELNDVREAMIGLAKALEGFQQELVRLREQIG